MKFKEYYITDKNGKSNCIIRTFCKLFNKEYEEIKQELLILAKNLNYDSYAEIEVFETYLNNNGYSSIDVKKDLKIKDLDLTSGAYAIFCYDKKDFYHMVCMIDNIIYDREPSCVDLYVITLYNKGR